MSDKKSARQRRASRVRKKIREINAVRLCVNRTPQHIYAQVIGPEDQDILASASTLEKNLKLKSTGNIGAAAKVGKLVAERAVSAGIKRVAFDRSGFKYHGRVKALAEAAREAGLEF